MSDNSIAEVTDGNISIQNKDNLSRFVNNEFLKPHEAFGKYVYSLIPAEARPLEAISCIQEASRRFNEVASDERKVSLFYHFTDAKGVGGITEEGLLGRPADNKIYLTTITPEIARPLSSTEDSKGFEIYVKGNKVPETLKEHMKKFVFNMKFIWKYHLQKNLYNKSTVPVGEGKLENVIILSTASDSSILKKDKHGEIYVEKPIKINSDPNFQVFGPYPTKNT